jgi:hypothetical protein
VKGAAAFGAIGPRIIAVIVNGTAQALEVCLIPTCKASAQAEDHGLDNLASDTHDHAPLDRANLRGREGHH